MANTKHSVAREIIIDRLLHKRRGYSVYEMMDIVNQSLQFEGYDPVSITTIRRDLDTIRCRYKQKLDSVKRSFNIYFRYEDPNFTAYSNVLTHNEIRHLRSALLSIRFVDPILGTLTYQDLSQGLDDMLNIDPASDPIVLYKKIPSEADQKRYKAIYRHIRTKTPAIITYTVDDMETEEDILVHPYFILYDCPEYFLLCHDATNNVAAKIPICKIRRMVSSPEVDYIPNRDFPLQDFYTKHLKQE